MSTDLLRRISAGRTDLVIDAKDTNGDSPLSWARWFLRPDPILRKLCYGPHHIRPGRLSMTACLLGQPA